MAKVGDQAHTPHGLGKITEVMNERGRLSFRVAGRGFSVWIDETKLHTASDELMSYGPMMDYAEQARREPQYGQGYDPELEHFAGLDSTIIPGDPYSVNEDNHTTLPYDYTPQNPVDLFAHEQTVRPGEYDIDADKRLRPSDSVSGQTRSKPSGPQPNPQLFAGGGGDHPFETTASLHRYAYDGFVGDHQHHDPNYGQGHSTASPMGEDIGQANKAVWDVIGGPGAAINWGLDKWEHHRQHHQSSAWDHTEGDHYGDYVHGHEGHDEDYSERDAGTHSRDPQDDTTFDTDHHVVYMGPEEYASYGQHGGEQEDKYSGGRHETYVEGANHRLDEFGGSGRTPIDPYRGDDEGSFEGNPEGHGHWAPEGNFHRPAGLSDRYAYYEIEADHNTPVASFRRDPQGFIRQCGYLWTDGDDTLERFAAYTDLVDHEAAQLGGLQYTSAWKDVRAKAQRLRHEGKVAVADAGPNRMYASVEGDNGVYDVMVYKAGAFGGNQSVLDWACSCDWGRWAFKRKFSYVGRLCSHAYATYLHMQSDHVKKHPIGKSAATVEDYKSYLKDNGQAPEASSVASYLNTQGNDASQEDVEKLYDYISNNPNEVRERDFKIPYVNDPDEAYKTADLLRTKPLSLTPDLREVPEGEGQKWMDLEKDERETTGPDQIVHFAAILRQLHGGEGITDFGTTQSGNASPDMTMPDPTAADPGAAPATPDPSAGLTAALHAGEVLQELRDLPPASDSQGHMDARNDRVRDLVDTAQDEGYDATQFVAAQNPKIPSDGNPDFLGQSSPGWADQGFAGSGPDPKDWYSDSAGYVEENEAPHHETDWFDSPDDDIIKYNDSRSKPAQGPRSARVGGVNPDGSDPTGGENAYANADDPTGLGGYENGLGGHFGSQHWADVSASDAGSVGQMPAIAPNNESLGGGSLDSPDQSFSDMTASLHQAEDLGYFNPNNAGADDWEQGSGTEFAQAVGDQAQNMANPVGDLEGGHGGGEAGAGEAGKAGAGEAAAGEGGLGALAELPIVASYTDAGERERKLDYSVPDTYHEQDPEAETYVRPKTSGFDVEAFDRGELSAIGGELRAANRVGSGPRQRVRIDPGSRDGRAPGAPRQAASHAPEDFGFDGVDESRYASVDDSVDIVAQFQRSAGAAAVMGGGQSSGGTDDFASSPMVQAMLRTAGRNYSPEEQRELEAEFHPQGARNMPTNDDLAGTHYLAGL